MEAPRCCLLILAHLRGLLRPYYNNGIRSIAAENMILQSISLEQQADFLKTQILATISSLAVLRTQDRPGIYKSAMDKFDVLKGLLFNRKYDVARLKRRLDFGQIVERAMEAGEIGPTPKNLPPDIKLSVEEADRRKAAGEDIPEWYIRTPEEEEIVKKMVADWEKTTGKKLKRKI